MRNMILTAMMPLLVGMCGLSVQSLRAEKQTESGVTNVVASPAPAVAALSVAWSTNEYPRVTQALYKNQRKPWSLISRWTLEKVVTDGGPPRYGIETAEYPLGGEGKKNTKKSAEIKAGLIIVTRTPLDHVGGERNSEMVGGRLSLFRW